MQNNIMLFGAHSSALHVELNFQKITGQKVKCQGHDSPAAEAYLSTGPRRVLSSLFHCQIWQTPSFSVYLFLGWFYSPIMSNRAKYSQKHTLGAF